MATTSPAQRVSLEVRVGMVRHGLSQRQLAEQLGMSQAALSRRLLGEVPFDINELDTLATLLDTTPAELLREGAA